MYSLEFFPRLLLSIRTLFFMLFPSRMENRVSTHHCPCVMLRISNSNRQISTSPRSVSVKTIGGGEYIGDRRPK